MQKSNSQLSETRILRHQSVGKFNYSGCCRNAAMTSAHPHRHCPELQHNFVPRKRFNLHQMHFQGHFVPRKRFKWYKAYQMRRLVPQKRFRWNKVEFPCLLSSPARSSRPLAAPHHARSPRQPAPRNVAKQKKRSAYSTDRLSCGW